MQFSYWNSEQGLVFYYYRAVLGSGCLLDNQIYNHVVTNGGTPSTERTRLEHFTREHIANGERPMYETRVAELGPELTARVRLLRPGTGACEELTLPARPMPARPTAFSSAGKYLTESESEE